MSAGCYARDLGRRFAGSRLCSTASRCFVLPVALWMGVARTVGISDRLLTSLSPDLANQLANQFGRRVLAYQAANGLVVRDSRCAVRDSNPPRRIKSPFERSSRWCECAVYDLCLVLGRLVVGVDLSGLRVRVAHPVLERAQRHTGCRHAGAECVA